MYENLRKYEYTGDKPSPAVKADRVAKAARQKVTDAIIAAEAAQAQVKAAYKAPKKAKKAKAKKAK